MIENNIKNHNNLSQDDMTKEITISPIYDIISEKTLNYDKKIDQLIF